MTSQSFGAAEEAVQAADLVTTKQACGETASDLKNLSLESGTEKSDDGSVTEKKEEEEQDEQNENLPVCTNKKILHRSGSSSFVRAHDLNIPQELQLGGRDVPSSTLHDSMRSQSGRNGPDKTATEGLFFMDQDMKLVLDQLTRLGYAEATDESVRFIPGRETANTLKNRERQPSLKPRVDPNWPIQPWHAGNPNNLRDILIWNGMVKNHKGFGYDWPIVKARGIIPTTPRNLVEFLWDSSNVKLYNTMTQGRWDGTIFQEGFDTRAEDSPYGFPGCAKILKSHNKIKMVPRIIEIISILHARPLGPPLATPGTYIIVNRSIWESDMLADEARSSMNSSHGGNGADEATDGNAKHKMIRSEVLLSAQLLRPANGGKYCEMTTITHGLAPGLNKTVAKTAANVSAAKILRDIQSVFMP